METHIYIDYSKLTFTVVKVWKTAGGFKSSEKIHTIKPSKFFISSYEKIDKLLKRYPNPTRILVNK